MDTHQLASHDEDFTHHRSPVRGARGARLGNVLDKRTIVHPDNVSTWDRHRNPMDALDLLLHGVVNCVACQTAVPPMAALLGSRVRHVSTEQIEFEGVSD